jgi:hypothetical protein
MVFPISNGRIIVRGHDGYVYGYDATRDQRYATTVARMPASRTLGTSPSPGATALYDIRGRLIATTAGTGVPLGHPRELTHAVYVVRDAATVRGLARPRVSHER